MVDVRIESLTANVQRASGHEHRIGSIANQAAAMFAERLHQRLGNPAKHSASVNIESLSAAPLDLNLGAMSDERIASTIASAWLESVAVRLRL
jgi:hypothetical protein